MKSRKGAFCFALDSDGAGHRDRKENDEADDRRFPELGWQLCIGQTLSAKAAAVDGSDRSKESNPMKTQTYPKIDRRRHQEKFLWAIHCDELLDDREWLRGGGIENTRPRLDYTTEELRAPDRRHNKGMFLDEPLTVNHPIQRRKDIDNTALNLQEQGHEMDLQERRCDQQKG